MVLVRPPDASPYRALVYRVLEASMEDGAVSQGRIEVMNDEQECRGPESLGAALKEPDGLRARKADLLRSRAGYEAWKAHPEPPCTDCGGGKGLGHTVDCSAARP